MIDNSIELDESDIEIELFIQAMYLRYGYDFRNYSRAHMKRRINHRLGKEGFGSISKMQHEVIRNPEFFSRIITDFSINVTEMFRDPDFFKYIRDEVIELLRSYPKINIWHAGCSSGQEVYSMAILLKEEGLLDRTTLYATDFNDKILDVAKEGIFPIEVIKEYTKNYIQSGGVQEFSDYYTAKYDSVIMKSELKKNIVFANHNLVTDSDFANMHMIICRNVLIYFDRKLQNRVLTMFTDSLQAGGILALGSKESLQYATDYGKYKVWNESFRVFQKKVFKG